MRTNKNILTAALAFGLVLSGVTYSQAQDAKAEKKSDAPPAASADAKPAAGRQGRGGGRGGQDRTAALKEALNLTDEQVTKLKPILQEQSQKARDLRADTALSQEDRRTKMRNLTQEFNTKIESILTPEQKEKWAKQRESQRGQRGGGGAGGTGGGAGGGQGQRRRAQPN